MRAVCLTLAIAAMAAPPAAAQDATTTCMTNLGLTTCRTTGSDLGYKPPIDYWSALNPKKDADADRKALRERLGRMVNYGQCDQARALALREGDLEAAAQLKSICD